MVYDVVIFLVVLFWLWSTSTNKKMIFSDCPNVVQIPHVLFRIVIITSRLFFFRLDIMCYPQWKEKNKKLLLQTAEEGLTNSTPNRHHWFDSSDTNYWSAFVFLWCGMLGIDCGIIFIWKTQNYGLFLNLCCCWQLVL